MAYHVFFSLSAGLSGPLFVPTGTRQSILEHVAWVEKELDIQTPGGGSKWHWFNLCDAVSRAEAETLCTVAKEHNDFVRRLYRDFGIWSKDPVKDGEQLTPKHAEEFWDALTEIRVPAKKWTEDYYRERMEHLYEGNYILESLAILC